MIIFSSAVQANTYAQTINAPCGIVDAMDYPVESMVSRTISQGYDDFGLFRNRWGGNHTGLDVAFREQGEPVFAAARGKVTYSNVEGWDTEGGVVILEHIFPDNTVRYTVYGHMEESNDYTFPTVGDCLEMGDVVGVVGDPASSAPHMHYEIRDFLPGDGGPGYVSTNPLQEGWFHPLDFTALWQLRLSPAFVSAVSFQVVPSLPPVELESGRIAIASGDTIAAVSLQNDLIWQVRLDSVATGLAVLSGERVIARSRNGQTVVLSNGRYAALWNVPGPEIPFKLLGETVVFAAEGGGILAYDATGAQLWSLSSPPLTDGRVYHLEANQNSVSIATGTSNGVLWRVVDSDGNLVHELLLDDAPLVTLAPAGGWLAIADGDLWRIWNGEAFILGSVGIQPGRVAQLTADIVGNTFVFLGDANNTLLSFNTSGGIRWRSEFAPVTEHLLAPLLKTDSGCLLYAMDNDGMLNIFNATDGKLVSQFALYAGGDQSGRPSARLLEIDEKNHLHLNAGFLTTATMDANILGADVLAACVPG